MTSDDYNIISLDTADILQELFGYTGRELCAIIDLLFIGLLSTYKLSALITRSIESSYKNSLLLAGFI